MSDESIHVSYAEGFEGLVEALKTLERPGDFQVSGKHESPMPILTVEGVGQLSFPVPALQARELIAAAAERAPYGRGDQTLVDESVRKVWQIAPEKISFEGKGWASKFEELVGRVAEGLGLPPKEVRADFYKLLVYDEGGFFQAHRDTEKAGGMFGTLVVALPSAHEGGELLVRHAGREVVVDLRGTDPGEVGFAAFYADCEHEVRPVVSGHRVCLVFNLILASRQRDGDAQPPDERPFVKKAAEALQRWTSHYEGGPKKVTWLLDHKYTASGLSFSSLKGRDAVVAKVLLEAAKISRCAFHLGIVHIEESGWAEYTGYGEGRGGRWDDDDDEEEEPEEDYEVGEVCDSYAFIDEWRDSSNLPVEFGKIPLGENEVLPPNALEGEDPDEIHFSEATGNAGADFERCYLRAAVVLWPESSADEICLSAGEEAGIERLQLLVRGRLKDSVEHLTELLIERWKGNPKSLVRLLCVLNEHGDPALLKRAVSELVPTAYDGSQNEALLGSARILPATMVRGLLIEHFQNTGPGLPGAALDLWNRLAAFDREQLGEPLLGVILDVLFKSNSVTAIKAPSSANTQSKQIDAPTFSHFLELLSAPNFAAYTARASALTEKNPLLLDVTKTLLPALESFFAATIRPPGELVNPFWRHASVFYLSRSENPPPVPVDWAQQVSVGSRRTPALSELELFARDPLRQVHRFRLKKQERQTIHQAIDQLGLDMTHVTERKGSPYTLVCTKTRTIYARACKQYRSDLSDMRRLLALPAAETPEFSMIANRLLAASQQRADKTVPSEFRPESQAMSAKVDLADKEAVYRALDGQ